MCNKEKAKTRRFMSVRLKLFLQIGAIFLAAVLVILSLNRWFLPEIYAYNTKRNMLKIADTIVRADAAGETDFDRVSALEKENGVSIDLYAADGEQLYYGKTAFSAAAGKVTVQDRQEEDNGAYMETRYFEQEKARFFVYVCPLPSGGTMEMYCRTTSIDENAHSAISVMVITSVAALATALLVVYFYSKRFTKPLIEMRDVTKHISEMDFSQKCTANTNDEIGELSASINRLSDSLRETLDDLSEKNKKLEDDIAREQRVDKMRKDFISNVSHELKTPISIILGYAEGAKLLSQGGEAEKAGEYCEIIRTEAERMNTLVLQLLELSRYESGVMQAQKEVFDLGELITQYLTAVSLRFTEAGITCSCDLPEKSPCYADKTKIRMVLNNFISNACAHASGEKQIRVSVTDADSTHFVLRVFNTGAPIAEEDIDKIWGSFYRADKAHSREEGRFGLGLSIVSEIQKLHGEKYGVENLPDGVEFWVTIQKADEKQNQ